MKQIALTRRTLLASALAPLLPAAADDDVRVGCQTRAYGSPLPNREEFLSAIRHIGEAGYEGFETNYRSLEQSFDDPGPIREEFQRHRVKMIGLHLGARLYDPAIIEDERRQIRRVARAVQELGGGHVILSGRRLPEATDGRADQTALESKARELGRAGKICRDLGVRLSFHNHAHELAGGAREIHFLLSETDSAFVSIVLDVGHVFPKELSVAECVRQFGNRIAAFHLRDTIKGKEVLIGTGDFEFKALGDVLRETRWKGWLIVEVNRRQDISSRDLIIRARQLLRETMKF